MRLAPTARVLVASATPVSRFAIFDEVIGNAAAVSQQLVQHDIVTTAAVYRERCLFHKSRVDPDPRPGKDHLAPTETHQLDRRGIIKVGSTVKRGEVLVGKLLPSNWTRNLTPEEKLLHAIFGRITDVDSSLRFNCADPGTVCGVELLARSHGTCPECGGVPWTSDEKCPYCGAPLSNRRHDDTIENSEICVSIDILIRRTLCVGDVLSDEMGNKLTVARLVPAAEMPIVGGKRVAVWVAWDSPLARQLANEGRGKHANLRGKRGNNRCCRFGRLKLKKLTRRVEDKLVARSAKGNESNYAIVSGFPIARGFAHQGQPVTKEVAQVLLHAGYPVNLMEMLTIKSDATDGRDLLYEALTRGEPVVVSPPHTLERLQLTLKGLCLSMVFLDSQSRETELNKDAVSFRIMGATKSQICTWSFGEVKKPETVNFRTAHPEKDGVLCERIFGPVTDWECACGMYCGMKYKGMICDRCGVKVTHSRVRRKRMGHIELAVPVVHFLFFRRSTLLQDLLGLHTETLEKIVAFENFTVIDPGSTPLRYGQLLTEEDYATARSLYGETFTASTGGDAIRKLFEHRTLDRPRSQGHPAEYMVLESIPVIPPGLRPFVPLEAGNFATSDLNDLYRRLINRNNRLKKLIELNAPDVILRNEKRMLQHCVDALFDNRQCLRPVLGAKERTLTSLTDMLTEVVRDVANKPVEFSARAIPVPDAKLDPGTIGVPECLAWELWEVFVIQALKQSGQVESTKSARKRILEDKDAPQTQAALQAALASRPILAISIALRIATLRPVLCDGESVRLTPADARSLEVKFNGDPLTLHLPLSAEAIAELSSPKPCYNAESVLSRLNPEMLVNSVVAGNVVPLEFLDRIASGIAGDA